MRTIIKTNNDIDIGTYLKLKQFLKNKFVGYRPKKAAVFPPEAIQPISWLKGKFLQKVNKNFLKHKKTVR